MKKDNPDDAGQLIGAKNFFVKTGRLRNNRLVDLEYLRFIDKRSGRFKKNIRLKRRNCPVCHGKKTRVAFVKNGFPHLICINCQMMYVSPILDEKNIDRFYKKSRVYDSVIKVMMNKVQRDFDKRKFEEGINLITQKLGRKGKILDVGCLTGHFLEIARKKGWDCTGIELNSEGLKICQKLGLKVISKKLTKSLFPKKFFDAVTLWDVLEHLMEPKKILKTINYILKPKGLLIILVPNRDSLAARILHEKCNMFNGCQHINLFSLKPLKMVLDNTGFKIRQAKTIISEISVLTNFLNYEHPYEGSGKAKSNLLGILESKDLQRKLLGYKLQVLAEKSN